ncbi:MAG: serine/threonine protein kinase [Phycisphaerales bacterium]|nr:serine/threonine protein kinase [Phycisphaerales bacterium]
MADDRNEELERLVALILSTPASERPALLERTCAGDIELRRQIDALLAAAEAEGLLGEATESRVPTVSVGPDAAPERVTPAADIPTSDDPLGEVPGGWIGSYKLLQLIGEGGFGSVFMAEQTEPVRRRVALKIIKLGMDTRQVVARFEQERQALALMNHPNIAKVLDAGATRTGRPFFVMELVKGEPIVGYCDRHNLSIAERLVLFAQVCSAVQHAHAKGIIHRDLKPSNILVSTRDGQPEPKVIDFGVAKATSARLTEKTLFTEHRQLVGTPEYMSPEQAEGSLDIDTRTDVYALGVLLYELLTGSTPFDSRQLRSAAYAEIQRIIREVEPPKPSTRLSGNADASAIANIAARRRTEPRKLGTALRGELDWIVMKAMEKDRGRRYETANGLAMDVQRYLAGEAVMAAPPSASYRLRKFVRRHRASVAAGGAVAVALLFGAIAFAWQAHVARGQRDRAVEAENEAKARTAELKQVADFQEGMLGQIDPAAAGASLTEDVIGRFEDALTKTGVSADERQAQLGVFRHDWSRVNATDAALSLIDKTILRPAVKAIDERFQEQPLVDAQLREVLADRYRDFGLYEPAAALETSALATRRRELGNEHPDTLSSINRMAYLLQLQDKLDEAEPLAREALETRRRVLGEDDPATLTSLNNMGFQLVQQGRLDEAEPFYREALERRRRVLGEDDPDTLTSINNMGYLLLEQGKRDQAKAYYREALEKRRRVLGNNHPDTLTSVNNMGFLLRGQGRFDEAEQYYLEALETRRRMLGDAHPDTLLSVTNLAFLFQREGKYAEAEPYFRDVMEKCPRVFGEGHLETIRSITNMGIILEKQGRLAEAEPYLVEALKRSRRDLGEENPNTRYYVYNMARLFEEQGRLPEAERYYKEAVEKFRQAMGDGDPEALLLTFKTANVLRAQGKYDESVAMLAPLEATAREAFEVRDVRRLGLLLSVLGRSRVGRGFDVDRFAAAESNLLEAHAILEGSIGGSNQDTIDCVHGLVELYSSWNEARPGKGYGTKAEEWTAKLEADAVEDQRKPDGAR